MSRWFLSACGLVLFASACAAGPERGAVSLLGEREYVREVEALKKELGILGYIGTPSFYGDSCEVWYHGRGEAVSRGRGIGLTFEHGRLAEVWFDRIDRAPGCAGDVSYEGALPLGIYRGETRGGILRRLGRPVARYHELRSTWCGGSKAGSREFSMLKYHDGPRAVIVMTRDDDRAPVTRVIVTLRDPARLAPDPALGLVPAAPGVTARCLPRVRQEQAREALASGCRKGARYRGCHRAGSRCFSFTVWTPQKRPNDAVALAAGLRLSPGPGTAGDGGPRGITTVVQSECDGHPLGDGRDPCEARDPVADCETVPEFALE